VLTDSPAAFALLGEPYLEYLPVVDLSSGRLLGMEALVRWQHPTEGRISPDRLIPEAEASGDIGPLTRWILMEACEHANQWSPSIQLGVNCTVPQLRRGEVSKAVSSALEQTGFPSGQLTLEVTEDAIVDPDASADLKHLSQMGVQLSVDDVGTNWSSFEPFRRHSISTVKIDGSFITGLEPVQGINRLVVETVIHMAHSLGMSAIVESVETASQAEIVRSFSADAAQGFFFARPMSSDDATAFAAGAEVPQFSLTKSQTLMKAHAGPRALTLFTLESDDAPEDTTDDAPEDATDGAPAATSPPEAAAATVDQPDPAVAELLDDEVADDEDVADEDVAGTAEDGADVGVVAEEDADPTGPDAGEFADQAEDQAEAAVDPVEEPVTADAG
jgi:EAL domain-containing protein (putative c-di-GMP-specific phosphodiesterase class I)